MPQCLTKATQVAIAGVPKVPIMYQVNEYYLLGKTFSKTTKHLTRVPTLEQAKAAADVAYQELKWVPESENVWVGVMDQTGHVMYGQPGLPGDTA